MDKTLLDERFLRNIKRETLNECRLGRRMQVTNIVNNNNAALQTAATIPRTGLCSGWTGGNTTTMYSQTHPGALCLEKQDSTVFHFYPNPSNIFGVLTSGTRHCFYDEIT